jgi:hypothetical protein
MMSRLLLLILLAFLVAGALWRWAAGPNDVPESATGSGLAVSVPVADMPRPPLLRYKIRPVAEAPADASSSPGAPAVPDEPVSEPTTAFGVPTAMISHDYPPYLGVVASWFPPRDHKGCKSSSALLAEMAGEPRDPLWAPRIEKELLELLEPHPLGFAISVGCRATICQVTSVGPFARALEHSDSGEVQSIFGLFGRRLRASPVVREFTRSQYFSGAAPMGEVMFIEGVVLTSVGLASSDEPADCILFDPAGHEPGGGPFAHYGS